MLFWDRTSDLRKLSLLSLILTLASLSSEICTAQTSDPVDSNPSGVTAATETLPTQNQAAPSLPSTETPSSSTAESTPHSEAQSPAEPQLVRLESLEQRLFNHSYATDSSADRLMRLEKFVFGVEGKGDTDLRLDKLNKVLGKITVSNDTTSANGSASGAKAPSKPRGLLDTINQGIDNYNRHRFHNAEDDFNDALNLAPGMSRIHVYLGATLLQLNQRQSALEAMRAAYELDPFGTYGRYAKHCLIVLMGDEEVRKRGPKDNLRIVQKTLEHVNSHANLDA